MSVHAERVEHLTAGVKDLFGAVFFISVGMMLDPGAVVKYIVPILILTLVTIVGKLIFSALGVLLSGHTLRQAIHCGCALAQIGEFAFIIASLGLSLGVIADYIYPIIISVSVITTLTTPFFIKSADGICAGIEKLLPEKLVQKLDRYTDEEQTSKEQDGDWAVFLRRYIKRTVFYGTLMLGIVILGDTVLLPLLEETIPAAPWVSKAVTLCAVYLCIVMFVRPMLDAHSPQYTVLWAKKRSFRLPLIALSIIRVLIIVLIVFLPIRTVLGIHSLWILPLLAAAVLLWPDFFRRLLRPRRLRSAVCTLAAVCAAVILWLSCLHAVFTTDKIVSLLGRVSPHLSLYLSILLRMVPRLNAQRRRIELAQRAIGRGKGQH